MRVLIAATALKGSLTPQEAALAMQKGIVDADTMLCPVADGGTGTLECLVNGLGGQYKSSDVMGPLPHMHLKAHFGVLNDSSTAVIETAQTCGIHLLRKDELDPFHATTYGVGELINLVLELGYKKILIGLGGSATVDGGAGCLKAIEDHLFQLLKTEVVLLGDVDTPLSQARLFMAQKGAGPNEVEQLEERLYRFIFSLEEKYHFPVFNMSGGGSGGGLGAMLACILHTPIQQGIDYILDLLDFDQKVKACDLILVSEGKLDAQTFAGKAIFGVINRARKFNKPVHAFVGDTEGDLQYLQRGLGLASIHTLASIAKSKRDSINNAAFLLQELVHRFFLHS
jgi:glycerate kinase